MITKIFSRQVQFSKVNSVKFRNILLVILKYTSPPILSTNKLLLQTPYSKLQHFFYTRRSCDSTSTFTPNCCSLTSYDVLTHRYWLCLYFFFSLFFSPRKQDPKPRSRNWSTFEYVVISAWYFWRTTTGHFINRLQIARWPTNYPGLPCSRSSTASKSAIPRLSAWRYIRLTRRHSYTPIAFFSTNSFYLYPGSTCEL